MAHLHITSLHQKAKKLLGDGDGSPRKLVLFHTVVALGAPLLVTVLNYLLEMQIAKTGGLGGMGTRSTLETLQSTLESAVMILLPFWEIGILYAALCWRKGEDVSKRHLTEGLRRFVNVFALRFWSGAVYVVLGIVTLYASTIMFAMTPLANPIMDMLGELGDAVTPEQLQEMMTPELTQQMMPKMIPLFIIFGVNYAAVCIPLFFRLRFAEFILLDGYGGIRSMLQSFRLTRRSFWQVVKLDLHFWWFYVLEVLCMVICYGSAVLALLGIHLPMSNDASFFLFYTVGIFLQGILFWRYQDVRLTTYCMAYDALQPQETAEET